MRLSHGTTILVVMAALAGCRSELPANTNRDEPAARRVGQEAYKASQDLKRGARKAAKELKEAGRELRQGWSEEKARDRARPPEPPPPPPAPRRRPIPQDGRDEGRQ
jgi:hypothetical protein